MHTSYFLFVMVITMFCYAVIKGRPGKVRQNNTDFCQEKVGQKKKPYLEHQLYTTLYCLVSSSFCSGVFSLSWDRDVCVRMCMCAPERERGWFCHDDHLNTNSMLPFLDADERERCVPHNLIIHCSCWLTTYVTYDCSLSGSASQVLASWVGVLQFPHSFRQC